MRGAKATNQTPTLWLSAAVPRGRLLKEETMARHPEGEGIAVCAGIDEATEFVLGCLEEMVDFASAMSSRHQALLKEITEASKQSSARLDEVSCMTCFDCGMHAQHE